MKSKSVIIVGGGINGLCAAYYLQKNGFEITIIDRGGIDDNCSFGNMGYVSPSHYVPLSSPGIVAEGLGHLLNSKSPFYMKPRLDFDFIKWALAFYKNSNQKTVDKNAGPLVDLLKLSRSLMDDIKEDLGDVFDMESNGIMMMCNTKAGFEKELKVAQGAKKYNLETIVLNRKEVQEHEPDVELNVYGAVLFTDDAHIHPGKFMGALKNKLKEQGVNFQLNTSVIGFEKTRENVKMVVTDKGNFTADYFLLSPGSWLGELTKKLGYKLMIQGGKGYSTTYDFVEKNIRYPAILIEGRCAMTPWKHSLRIGGTMEFSGLNSRILVKRMQGIYESVKKFYPGLKIEMPSIDKIWTGLRPVSPDGLPYIGTLGHFENVMICGGNAMLGISEGAGVGKLISQVMAGEHPSLNLSAFDVNRYN